MGKSGGEGLDDSCLLQGHSMGRAGGSRSRPLGPLLPKDRGDPVRVGISYFTGTYRRAGAQRGSASQAALRRLTRRTWGGEGK